MTKTEKNAYQRSYNRSHPEVIRAANRRQYLRDPLRGQRRFKMTQEFVNRLKNKPCTDCHGWYEPCQMDFDHINPSNKSSNVSVLIYRRRPKRIILAEIAKCELVCANCHRLRTWKRRN